MQNVARVVGKIGRNAVRSAPVLCWLDFAYFSENAALVSAGRGARQRWRVYTPCDAAQVRVSTPGCGAVSTPRRFTLEYRRTYSGPERL